MIDGQEAPVQKNGSVEYKLMTRYERGVEKALPVAKIFGNIGSFFEGVTRFAEFGKLKLATVYSHYLFLAVQDFIWSVTNQTTWKSQRTSLSSGLREFAPVLARAAVATGYVSGLFVEAHTNPNEAKSDAATQLSLEQTETLLRQLIPMLKASNELAQKDGVF